MEPIAAFGSLGMTLLLVTMRPRVGRFGRLNPVLGALPGVIVMLAFGVLTARDLGRAFVLLWRPFVTLASIMATTHVAHRLGIFDRITRSIEIRTRGPVPRAFATVYVISAVTAALFNNDAAILLLTPIVVPVIRRLYPKRPYLVVPFSFAVFMAAGVAPLCTSNPMNLVVAEHAGIGFNTYALRMLPVSLVGAVVTYVMMRFAFKTDLEDSIPARGPEMGSLADLETSPRLVLVVVIAMLASYPVLSYFEAPVWLAALVGAVMTTGIGVRSRRISIGVAARGVAWDIIAFLFFIFVTALGLENIGVTHTMARLYGTDTSNASGGIAVIGGMSALGSAVLNNHPMAALNALAIGSLPGENHFRTLAALVGGDLGPRLLPIGSLAGLLWLEMTRRLGVEIRALQFVRVGAIVTLPALAVSLFVLWLESKLF